MSEFKKRGMFYPDGRMIPARLPQSYRKSDKADVCGNCGLFANARFFCGKWHTNDVRDTYTCHEWRKRHFKR